VGGVDLVEKFVHSEHHLDFTGAPQTLPVEEAVGGCGTPGVRFKYKMNN